MEGLQESNLKRILKDKKERSQGWVEPSDGKPMLEFLSEAAKEPIEVRRQIAAAINEFHDEMGRVLLDRVLSEGLMSERRWVWYREKGITERGIATVLEAYYAKLDGYLEKDSEVVLVTSDDEPIYRLRKSIYNDFGVLVVSAEEALARLKKGDRPKVHF